MPPKSGDHGSLVSRFQSTDSNKRETRTTIIVLHWPTAPEERKGHAEGFGIRISRRFWLNRCRFDDDDRTKLEEAISRHHHRFSPPFILPSKRSQARRYKGRWEFECGERGIENGGTQCNAVRLGSGVNDGGYEGPLLLSLLFFLNSAPYSGLYSIETGGMK